MTYVNCIDNQQEPPLCYLKFCRNIACNCQIVCGNGFVRHSPTNFSVLYIFMWKPKFIIRGLCALYDQSAHVYSVCNIIWQEFLHNSAEICKIMQNYLHNEFDPAFFDS